MTGAAIAMFVLYGLLALVTHLAAPIGAVWKVQPGIDGSNLLGMAGNMMTFGAYLFMGIPAGRMLMKIGYKRTALAALVLGVVGTIVQIAARDETKEAAMMAATMAMINICACGMK